MVREMVGGRRLQFDEGPGPGLRVCWWWEGGRTRRVERLFGDDVRVSTGAAAAAGGTRFTRAFPPDGGTEPRAVAGWGGTPGVGVEGELMFPKWAEIREVEVTNEDWFHGFYMGAEGLFPAPYVRFIAEEG